MDQHRLLVVNRKRVINPKDLLNYVEQVVNFFDLQGHDHCGERWTLSSVPCGNSIYQNWSQEITCTCHMWSNFGKAGILHILLTSTQRTAKSSAVHQLDHLNCSVCRGWSQKCTSTWDRSRPSSKASVPRRWFCCCPSITAPGATPTSHATPSLPSTPAGRRSRTRILRYHN